MLWAGVIAAPVVWLMLLQTNYILAYPTCAGRSNAWLHVTTAAGLVLMVMLAVGATYVWRTDPREQRTGAARLEEQRDPVHEDPSAAARHFLAVLALFLTGLSILLLIGTWVPALVLRPCD